MEYVLPFSASKLQQLPAGPPQTLGSWCTTSLTQGLCDASASGQKSTYKQSENHSLPKCDCDCHADENRAWKYFRCKTNRERCYNLISDLQSLCEMLYTCSMNWESAVPWTAYTQHASLTQQQKIIWQASIISVFSPTHPLIFVVIFRVTRGSSHILSLPTPEFCFLLNWRHPSVSSPSSSLFLRTPREHRPKVMKFFTQTFWTWNNNFFPASSCKIIVISNTCNFLKRTNLKYTHAGLWIFSC